MANQQKFEEALTRIEAATTKIGERITALEEAIVDEGLPAEVEARLLAKTEGLADALEAMGKDPDNPVPDELGFGMPPLGDEPNPNPDEPPVTGEEKEDI